MVGALAAFGGRDHGDLARPFIVTLPVAVADSLLK
jgi:hypothetical protein